MTPLSQQVNSLGELYSYYELHATTRHAEGTLLAIQASRNAQSLRRRGKVSETAKHAK